jgi:hypothetical protein
MSAASNKEERVERTALYQAARKGRIEECKYLLKMGAKVDTGPRGPHPLIAAAKV